MKNKEINKFTKDELHNKLDKLNVTTNKNKI